MIQRPGGAGDDIAPAAPEDPSPRSAAVLAGGAAETAAPAQPLRKGKGGFGGTGGGAKGGGTKLNRVGPPPQLPLSSGGMASVGGGGGGGGGGFMAARELPLPPVRVAGGARGSNQAYEMTGGDGNDMSMASSYYDPNASSSSVAVRGAATRAAAASSLAAMSLARLAEFEEQLALKHRELDTATRDKGKLVRALGSAEKLLSQARVEGKVLQSEIKALTGEKAEDKRNLRRQQSTNEKLARRCARMADAFAALPEAPDVEGERRSARGARRGGSTAAQLKAALAALATENAELRAKLASTHDSHEELAQKHRELESETQQHQRSATRTMTRMRAELDTARLAAAQAAASVLNSPSGGVNSAMVRRLSTDDKARLAAATASAVAAATSPEGRRQQ